MKKTSKFSSFLDLMVKNGVITLDAANKTTDRVWEKVILHGNVY